MENNVNKAFGQRVAELRKKQAFHKKNLPFNVTLTELTLARLSVVKRALRLIPLVRLHKP